MNETLVSSECVYIHAFNKLLNQYGYPSVQKDYMDYIHDMTCEAVNEAWFGVKMEQKIHQEYELYYKSSSYNHLTIINNSLNFIKKCHNQGLKQVIITNKPDFIAIPELKRLGFFDFIDLVIGKNEKYKKGSKKMLNLILKKLNFLDEKNTLCREKNLWIFGNSMQEYRIAENYNAKLFLCCKINEQKEKKIIYTNNFNEIEFL